MTVTRAEYELYRAALEGDRSPLADALRSGAELSSEVRNLIAEILEGKLKPPRHRPKRRETDKLHLKMAQRVLELEGNGWKRESAVDEAARQFKCSPSTVWTALREIREQEAAKAQIDAELEAQFREILARTLSPEEVERALQYRREQLAIKSAT